MPAEPWDDPAFANAVTWTVAITYTVAGGARHGTADRRAAKVAEQLANTACRCAGVVEVSATAGHSDDGTVTSPQRVRFAAANSGQGTYSQPDKLDRWVDPDRDLARQALTAHNAAADAHRRADTHRRLAVDCANTHRSPLQPADATCGCAYCQPADHLQALRAPSGSRCAEWPPRCLCGAAVDQAGHRCWLHPTTALVVLDGDAAALRLLADQLQTGDAR